MQSIRSSSPAMGVIMPNQYSLPIISYRLQKRRESMHIVSPYFYDSLTIKRKVNIGVHQTQQQSNNLVLGCLRSKNDPEKNLLIQFS